MLLPNLYAYTGDDPTDKNDPTGEHDAPVVVILPNGETKIYIPVKLTGNTPEVRSAAMSAAQAKSSQITSSDGKLSVTIEDADAVKASNPIKFDISNGKQDVGNAQGEGIDTQHLTGHLDGTRPDIGSEINHDGLHPFGVRDEYTYVRDKNGNIVKQPNGDPVVVSDPKNHNIMGPNMGNTFNQNQLNNQTNLRNPKIKDCHAMDNAGGGCQ